MGFKPLNFYRDRIRNFAEAFINDEIGVERVVSICEHSVPGPFSVSIWYRAESGAASESRVITSAQLKEPQGFPVTAGR